jgi:flagellar biosynthesis protein FlhF
VTEHGSRFGASGDPERVNPEGVRTYRGRTVEELIPRIRAELGPDAIILREREGLTGGIGGFFAQRCVEIDAQAAPRLSVYDDDYDDEEYDEYEEGADADDLGEEPDVPRAEPAAAEPPPAEPAAAEPPPSRPAAAEPPPAQPASDPSRPARAAAPFLNEASFAARLEEATFSVEDSPAAPPPPAHDAAAPVPPTFIAFDELGDGLDEPPAQAASADTAAPAPPPALHLSHIDYSETATFGEGATAPRPATGPVSRAAPETTVPPQAPVARPAPADVKPDPRSADLQPDPAAPWMTFAAEQAAAADLAPAAPRPAPPAPPASAAPPPLAPPPPAARSAPAPAALTQPPPAAPQPAAWAPAPGYGPRRRGGLLPVAERMLRAALEATTAANERRNLEPQPRAYPGAPSSPPPPPTPAPAPLEPAQLQPAQLQPAQLQPAQLQPAPLQADPDADTRAQRFEEEHRREAELERRLVAAGMSSGRATALVATAITRRGPFSSDGELADELRQAIVAALPAPRPLPKESAIAMVGAGGSGKTRCVAALATAYAGADVPVSVASFGGPAREDELGELLHSQNVNVIPAMRTRATARAVASAREHSLVIVDTAAATPGDGSTIDVIVEALRSFELDAVYLAVPATLSLPAARKLVDGFAAFELAGLVATHVDEADQLGVIAELAMQTGIPVAYTHTGLDLQTAIASADAGDIANSLV